jgi:hypothetical protein
MDGMMDDTDKRDDSLHRLLYVCRSSTQPTGFHVRLWSAKKHIHNYTIPRFPPVLRLWNGGIEGESYRQVIVLKHVIHAIMESFNNHSTTTR